MGAACVAPFAASLLAQAPTTRLHARAACTSALERLPLMDGNLGRNQQQRDGRAWARAPLLSHTHMETGGLNRFSTNMEDEPPPGAATVVPVQSGDTFADFEGDSRAMAAATAAARSKDMGAASATSDAPTRCQCPRLMYWHARCIGVTWRICKKEYKNDPAYLRQSAQENARCIGIRSRFPLSRELCSSVDDLSRNGRRGRLHARRRPIDGEHARGARKTVS